MEILVAYPVLHSGIGAVGLRVAEARVGAGIAKRRKRIGAAHRIVGDDAVERQRGHSPDRERSESLIAEADVSDRVVKLPGAARVEVCALEDERQAVILHERAWSVDDVAGIGVKSTFHGADEVPAREPRNRLLYIDPDHRLVDAVRRPQPLGSVALLADETINAVGVRAAGRRTVGAVAEAGVNRCIDGDARVAQGTIRGARIQIGPEARKAVHRRRRRG